jgi:FixJ family two-component response regulator
MTDKSKAHIFVVDDDPDTLNLIGIILEVAGFEYSCFTKADDCLQQLHKRSCVLLITDVRMPGKDGMELLAKAKHIIPWLPVIVITGFGNIPMAVKAVKAGAFDFIQKPLDSKTFLTIVGSALNQDFLVDILKSKSLTKMETIVLRLIVGGRTNKEIARILRRSVRTVEVHRSHIMHKLNVDNVVDLVKRADAMGFGDTT